MTGGALATLRDAGFQGPYACAVVAGTGLGALAEGLEDAASLDYAAIPGFPGAGVSGHRARLHRGRIAGRPVLVFEGRAHAYEAGDAAVMRLPLTCARDLGARCLFLTNAAGSLRPEVGPGRLAMLTDHINLSGLHPLIGEADDARFVPMTDAYDPALRARLAEAARGEGIALAEGIYAWFSGPSFETPAEVRMAGILGADLVGMSTTLEAIAARHCGLEVLGVSLVTNLAAGISPTPLSHAEVIEAGQAAGPRISALLADIAKLV